MAVSRGGIQSPWTVNAITESGLGCSSRDGCPPERQVKYGLDSAQDEQGVNALREGALGGRPLWLSVASGKAGLMGFSTPDMSSMLLLSPKCYFPSEKPDHKDRVP